LYKQKYILLLGFFLKGLIHEVVNISCNNGSFISVFGDEDPGILQVASRLFQIPEEALSSTFNTSKSNVKYLKYRIQQNPSAGFDSECLTRCKINK